jgi:hypothetical protein
VAWEKAGDDYHGKWLGPLPRTDMIVRAGAPIDLAVFRRQPVDGILLQEATDLTREWQCELSLALPLTGLHQGLAPIGFFDPGEYGVQAP